MVTTSDADKMRSMNTALLSLAEKLVKLVESSPRSYIYDTQLQTLVDEARDLIARAERGG